MMLPPVVLYEFVVAVDLHRDTLASLVPREAGVPIWALVSTTMPIANRGPVGVLRALEELPVSLVGEISNALTGRLPEIHVPSLAPFVRPAHSAAGAGTRPWGPAASATVVESARYVLDEAPHRVQFLLDILQAPMPQLARDARSLSDDAVAADLCARYAALGATLARAVLAGMSAPGLDPERAAVGIGLGLAVVMARVTRVVAARLRREAEKGIPTEERPAPPIMEGHSAADSRIILSDLGMPTPPTPDASFASNGLVVPIAGGLVIRTGAPNTFSLVTLCCVDAEPNAFLAKWEDVVEVSFSATGGLRLAPITTLWLPDPGDYRARVHACRRDAGVEDGDCAGEEYEIVVWPAPPAPERIVKSTDRLGHRLRGEPEPALLERPEVAFHPIADLFPDGATVTVTIGSTLDEILLAYRAPPLPHSSNDQYDGLLRPTEIPSRTADQLGVLVIEVTDSRGSEKSVLQELSKGGRAASMSWNVNAVTTLSLAENGELLEAFEWWDEATHPAVLALFDGLDIHDNQDNLARGLVVIERFTGCTVTESLVSQMEAMTMGYRLSR